LDDRLDRGLADFDTPERLVISEIWEVPFDHFVHSDGFAKKAAKGWQLNTIASFQKGNPLTFYSNQNESFQNNGLDRTDIIGPVPYVNPRHQNSFPSDCNGSNAATSNNWWINATNLVFFSYGDLGRNTLRGPGIDNYDMSVTKKTNISENKSVEFRAEFFNIFNHTQFYRVDNGGGSPTFGQVIADRGPRLIQFGLKFYF
jgi:hypothetical protein